MIEKLNCFYLSKFSCLFSHNSKIFLNKKNMKRNKSTKTKKTVTVRKKIIKKLCLKKYKKIL